MPFRKALPDMLALKPYWGKPAVRDYRGDDGNVGIIRSPVRTIVLLDRQCTYLASRCNFSCVRLAGGGSVSSRWTGQSLIALIRS